MSIPVSRVFVWIMKRTIEHDLSRKIKIGNHSITILLKVEPLNDCSLKTRNVILFDDELFHEKRIFSLFEQELIIKFNFWKKLIFHSCRSYYIDLLLIKMAVLAMFQEMLSQFKNPSTNWQQFPKHGTGHFSNQSSKS